MQRVEIRVRGQLDQGWSDYFGGLTIAHTSRGETLLTGPVIDQAELRGIVMRLADLGLDLLSINASAGSRENFREP
jgi:hypothetical protein